MKLNKLILKDQKLFKNYLALEQHDLAAYSFANIYIWRCLYEINWTIINDSLCVFFSDALGCFVYLPPLAKKQSPLAIKQCFEIMDKVNKNKDISRIENISGNELAYYRSLGYLVQGKDPDYICLKSDLVQLKGNKFKSQRAACNYFIKHNNFECVKLKLIHRAECLALFDAWAKARKARSGDDLYCGMIEDNYKVIKAALINYKQLGLDGLVVRVDKKIIAFSFGYRLNKDTFCILYEITDLAIKGLAQFIFRYFCQDLKDYKYINIMDDSGLENLRKVKLSYKPNRLEPAYIVSRDA